MTLRALADLVELSPADEDAEAQLKARLTNLLAGLRLNHLTHLAAKRRIEEMKSILMPGGGLPASLHRDTVLRAHTMAMNAFAEQDHYCRPERLEEHLGARALTIQVNEGGALGLHWLGRRASGLELELAFRADRLAGHVGAPDRPLWLTPLVDDVLDLYSQADREHLSPAERAVLARAMADVLGLSHVHNGNELLAFVTHAPIGDLLGDSASAGPVAPVGPTAIEARAHRRFRPWPRRGRGAYGRTYALDRSTRSRSMRSGWHGCPEAVIPRLEMIHFADCRYLGRLVAVAFEDLDSEYLEEIGATESSAELLRRLADEFGL